MATLSKNKAWLKSGDLLLFEIEGGLTLFEKCINHTFSTMYQIAQSTDGVV